MDINGTKCRQAADHLESMIVAGNFKTGERLPSLREICTMLGVRLNVARRAVHELEERKLVECIQGKGVFVASPAPVNPAEGRLRVAVFADVKLSAHGMFVLRGVQEAALEAGVIVEVHPEPYYRYEEAELLKLIEKTMADCDALILIGTYDCTLSKLPLRKPVVGIEMNESFGGVVSTLTLDPFEAGRLAADFFREHGFRKVALFRQNLAIDEIRCDAFKKYWNGEIAGETVTNWQGYAGVEAITPEDPACGCLFADGTLCNAWIRRQLRSGRPDPNLTLTLLSIDGKSMMLSDFPKTPSITPDWVEMGKAGLAEVLRRLRTLPSSSMRSYLDVRLRLPDKT